jgi:hypothetical protein
LEDQEDMSQYFVLSPTQTILVVTGGLVLGAMAGYALYALLDSWASPSQEEEDPDLKAKKVFWKHMDSLMPPPGEVLSQAQVPLKKPKKV